MKYFVGCSPKNWEVFRFDGIPVESDDLPYSAVIGPFRTKRGAEFMAKYGRGNPHCRCVADTEKLAKKYSGEVR